MTYYGRWTYKFEEAARQGAEVFLSFTKQKGPATNTAFPEKARYHPIYTCSQLTATKLPVLIRDGSLQNQQILCSIFLDIK